MSGLLKELIMLYLCKKEFLFDYDDESCISNENVSYVKPRERDSHSIISMPLPLADVMEPFSDRFKMTIATSLNYKCQYFSLYNHNSAYLHGNDTEMDPL